MTGEDRYKELYDELERLARSLVDCYDTDRGIQRAHMNGHIEGYQRRVDPQILIGRAEAINDCASELKFLQKFRGSLGLVS